MTAYVYRCFDAEGGLLYIGCAHNPKRRISSHLHSRKVLASHALRVLMDRYEVEGPYPTRELAERAEAAAIRAEEPLLNRQHNGVRANWLRDNDLARYLYDHGIPLEAVGLHRCEHCDILIRHSIVASACQDCRDALAEGRLHEWLAAIA